MPSALIIGAGGQDGRLLAELLRSRDYAVRGWTRAEPVSALPCECVKVDILDRTSIEADLREAQPEEIYYLAAFHHSTEDSVTENTAEILRQSFDVHVSGLLNALHAAKLVCPQSRLFYAASSHIFGTPSAEWQNEKTPLRPNSAYGISKAAGVRCCQLFRAQEDFFAATGILFNHESSLRKPSFVSQKIVRGALEAQRNRGHKVILGDLDALVDWGYAPDYVDAMHRILQLPTADDYVIASGELYSVRQFAEAAFEEVGLDWQEHVETDPRLLKRKLPPLRGDSTKFRTATGWGPTVNFRELVGRLVSETEAIYGAR